MWNYTFAEISHKHTHTHTLGGRCVPPTTTSSPLHSPQSSPLISTSKQNVMCLDSTLIWPAPPALSSVTDFFSFFQIQDVPEFKKLIMIFFFFFRFSAASDEARLADKLQASETKNQMCEIWWLLELIRSALRLCTDREIVFAYLNVNWEWSNAVIFLTVPLYF